MSSSERRSGTAATLALLTFGHMATDGVCAASLRGESALPSAFYVLLYDFLAFVTQPLAGMLVDRFRRERIFLWISISLLLAGYFLPLPFFGKILLLGLGNSLYHVTGGSAAIRNDPRIRWFGVFVSGGAPGLAIGLAYPSSGLFFAISLLALAALTPLMVLRDDHEAEEEKKGRQPAGAYWSLFVLAAIAVRSMSGSLIPLSWKTGAASSVIASACALAGKATGGLFADRFGIRKTVLAACIAGGLLLCFGHDAAIPSLAGTVLINWMMPVTLWLLCRIFPDSPGFAFGSTACALFAGFAAGLILRQAFLPAADGIFLGGCLAAALCVLYADRRI